jgi:uncharacterized protein (DUF2235 family)
MLMAPISEGEDMKRIAICCDGTWNKADQEYPTNVAKITSSIADYGNGALQRVFYDNGVGTGGPVNKVLGGVLGLGLAANVWDAYRFLVDNYESGDELYFFGFSRGAYTARSTVGMIRKCGILRRDQADHLNEAYRLYKNSKIHPDDCFAKNFRRDHSVLHEREPADATPVKFIGVWDTVGALGVPVNLISRFTAKYYQFHDVALSRSVENAYQALAIDEKRRDYKATLWEQHPNATNQKLEQRWFAGVHRNVGGGTPDSRQPDRTFRWIQQKAAACGLAFDQQWIAANIKDDEVGPLEESRTGVFLLRALFWRPIGKGVPPGEAIYLGGRSHEDVDPAVIKRNLKDPSYRPLNLVFYYREFPEALEEGSQAVDL